MTSVRALSLSSISLVFAASLVAGCTAPNADGGKPSKMFSLDSTWPFRDGDKPRQGTPVRVVGTWTDTVMTQPGQKPQRGFGGRLVFYGKKDEKPILVEGQLVVYAFDEANRAATDNKPTRRYVFPPDQVPLHMSVSEIGASYSFWLPWDEAGGPRTEVSLICRFEPKGGAVISSEQTRHLLPGTLAPNATAIAGPPALPEGVAYRPARPTLQTYQSSRQADAGAQQASYEVSGDPHAATPQGNIATTSLVPERRMGVTSIKLPDNYDLRAAANAVLSQQPTPMLRSPAATPAAQAATAGPRPAAPTVPSVPTARATLPGVQPPASGFSSPQLARPQFITPQFMSLQPAPVANGTTPTVTQPAAAPMVR